MNIEPPDKTLDHGVDALLRLPEVIRLTGRGRWSIYADVRDGTFTRPVPLGKRAVGWPASEVAALNRARVAGLVRSQLVTLVDELHATRPTAVSIVQPQLKPRTPPAPRP